MNHVLVTGGAGYIGSHTVCYLLERGLEVVVLDSLTTGHGEAVPHSVPLYIGDISDRELVSQIINRHQIDAVIHFAAHSSVSESIAKPDLYFEENTAKTAVFLSTLMKRGIKQFILSSTAAVYGLVNRLPIPEETNKKPINPYGLSKWMIEQQLEWLERAYGLRWMALRYFNAAGAMPDGSMGEDHSPEQHLIPLVLKTAQGKRGVIHIFGTDYPTPDGTCIRDYIHVLDLARAHYCALMAINNQVPSQAVNVGTGKGYSVKEVIATAEAVVKQMIPVVEKERRPGDPAILLADAYHAKKLLQWQPQYSDLYTIIENAWQWHQLHPEGYQGERSLNRSLYSKLG
ncbi:UDP-glucose 4-epimerase GalE [Hazenella sp. IB182357]|uniref:UDP-glucose 4-epimerase n=1 Tax=Polycladospora coralii TaxID=2771432 RepID=A0A926NCH1_9BACL|nr:UDP-glucose 4-epimerase GalE [Polycladospora coralii]MBD1373285.1 UDP-glucose 4-epimerase GalE [Polycladospora coralii]MBS7528900.1 UDP-glucose 4-epimerase GalE [Polycladospora coralii]